MRQHIIQLKRWYWNGLGNEGFDGHQEHLGNGSDRKYWICEGQLKIDNFIQTH